MKTNQLLTEDLKTGDITIISNVTSFTVTGTKIARVEEIPGHEQESPSAVHVDFEVKQPRNLLAEQEETKNLGLILQLNDAVELGVLLVAMGMEHKTPDQAVEVTARLSKLIADFQPD